ncbi:MAG TPA: hypothetical protein VEQ63_05360 [Bryobacteraceae bacterium]|nr:hypothetical protein [Bryobacteraceae bacterium]
MDDLSSRTLVEEAAQRVPAHSHGLQRFFSGTTLAEHWEWNHQPRADKWSLTARPGFLRLHAFQPLKSGDFWTVGDTISQRAWRTPENEVTAEFDLGALSDGQHPGLVHYGRTFCTLGVVQSGTLGQLELNDNGKLTAGPAITGDKIWLRSVWDWNRKSQFSFSFDGRRFTPVGDPYKLTWGRYRGDRIGVFTYNDLGEGGHVDLASFRHVLKRP